MTRQEIGNRPCVEVDGEFYPIDLETGEVVMGEKDTTLPPPPETEEV